MLTHDFRATIAPRDSRTGTATSGFYLVIHQPTIRLPPTLCDSPPPPWRKEETRALTRISLASRNRARNVNRSYCPTNPSASHAGSDIYSGQKDPLKRVEDLGRLRYHNDKTLTPDIALQKTFAASLGYDHDSTG
jgi:hypothetical protein